MSKDFTKYMFSRLREETALTLIDKLLLRPEEKEVLKRFVHDRGKRGWQKIYAYELGVDEKTVSRRYNKALDVSTKPLISYVASLLERT